MSGENMLAVLGSEEIFESYGTEFYFREIMENIDSDIERIFYVGHFLLNKFCKQKEEIFHMQSILSEQNQELKHLKEKQEFLKTIETNYQRGIHETEAELAELKRTNDDYKKTLDKLQREIDRSNESESALRRSIYELTASRKNWAFQPDTLKLIAIKDYCVLCLNTNKHINNHKRKDMISSPTKQWSARNVCTRLKLDIQIENRWKELLNDKLFAVCKEADDLRQYLQWARPGVAETIQLKEEEEDIKLESVPQKWVLTKMEENRIRWDQLKISNSDKNNRMIESKMNEIVEETTESHYHYDGEKLTRENNNKTFINKSTSIKTQEEMSNQTKHNFDNIIEIKEIIQPTLNQTNLNLEHICNSSNEDLTQAGTEDIIKPKFDETKLNPEQNFNYSSNEELTKPEDKDIIQSTLNETNGKPEQNYDCNLNEELTKPEYKDIIQPKSQIISFDFSNGTNNDLVENILTEKIIEIPFQNFENIQEMIIPFDNYILNENFKLEEPKRVSKENDYLIIPPIEMTYPENLDLERWNISIPNLIGPNSSHDINLSHNEEPEIKNHTNKNLPSVKLNTHEEGMSLNEEFKNESSKNTTLLKCHEDFHSVDNSSGQSLDECQSGEYGNQDINSAKFVQLVEHSVKKITESKLAHTDAGPDFTEPQNEANNQESFQTEPHNNEDPESKPILEQNSESQPLLTSLSLSRDETRNRFFRVELEPRCSLCFVGGVCRVCKTVNDKTSKFLKELIKSVINTIQSFLGRE